MDAVLRRVLSIYCLGDIPVFFLNSVPKYERFINSLWDSSFTVTVAYSSRIMPIARSIALAWGFSAELSASYRRANISYAAVA